MLQRLRRERRWKLGVIALAALSLAAAGCHQVASGHLNVANDLSGLGQDNTIFRAYVADPGDVWPPAGFVNIYVRGDDFGSPPSYGMNGFLYLVRTSLACPESEGAPETFELSDVTIVGVITVVNGSVSQFVTMQDTPVNREPTWALIDIPELSGFPSEHLIFRCGTVTWTP